MELSSPIAVCASSPEVLPATESTGEEESVDENTIPHVWNAAEDRTRMQQLVGRQPRTGNGCSHASRSEPEDNVMNFWSSCYFSP